MKFAVIPWADRFLNNELFNTCSDTNKNGLAEPYAEMKRRFEETGNEISTIDMYDDLSDVDFILFFDWFPEWIFRIIQMGFAYKMVYCNAEPPTVRAINSRDGYEKIKK